MSLYKIVKGDHSRIVNGVRVTLSPGDEIDVTGVDAVRMRRLGHIEAAMPAELPEPEDKPETVIEDGEVAQEWAEKLGRMSIPKALDMIASLPTAEHVMMAYTAESGGKAREQVLTAAESRMKELSSGG